ncbi:MAG: ABC transporter substrate-binding protein [Bacteroidales bacterium]|jgi:iron complex transport system substrate-binding protein
MTHLKTKLILLYSLALSACVGNKGVTINSELPNGNEYAKHFKVSGNEENTKFEIIDNWSSSNDNTNSYSFVISTDKESNDLSTIGIKYPVKRVVCMSTSHIAYMKALGLTNLIVGVSGKQYISDKDVLMGIEKETIYDIGYEGSLNYELLLRLNPDIVFTYGIMGENNVYIDKIRELGIDVIALGDYLEDHPLGKLEYLKLFGSIFNCTQRADSIYNSVKSRYLSLKESVNAMSIKPKILLNAPWKEVWYIPGELNYISVLIHDAGGELILSESGISKSIAHNLEEVYQKAMIADFWLNPNNYKCIEELRKSNPLFKNIPSLKNGKVYNNNKRETLNGGSDFWETGVTEPDVILNDLINILHPETASKRELVYYKRLE